MKRLNKFLNSPELTNYVLPNDEDKENYITLENCSFGWSKIDNDDDDKKRQKKAKAKEKDAEAGTKKASKGKKNDKEKVPEVKEFLKNINLKIKKNTFVAIVGSVGSGKSSLLNAILGNMELLGGSIKL